MKKIFFILLVITINLSCASVDRSRLDPKGQIPKKLLSTALDYFDSNSAKINNKDLIAIIDFKAHNSKERFYLLSLQTGDVESFLVAHGKNSDKNFDGYAESFSNEPDSLKSSLGFYLTAETYEGDHGYSLRLDGLSTTNSNARNRAIVIHGADYVAPGDKIGRSFGCPAVEMRYHQYIIDKIKAGTLIYAGIY